MSILSLGTKHLSVTSATEVHDIFRTLGYSVYDPDPFEGDDLDPLELDETTRRAVQRAYIIARLDNHTIYLYEVNDLRQTQLRGLGWHALQRGTALLVVTQDYREILFVDPRFVGKPNKSNVRVNKLKVVTSDPTRHDADTLNAIHAHRRKGQEVYDAQAAAFNITTITKKFYEEYRQHYERARAAIRRYNPAIAEFQNSDQTNKLHAFTQRLLGRLMFLYFLQRKGWLGGRQKFLTEMYLQTMRQHSDEVRGDQESFYYYRELLEPLFFATMNTRRPDNITQWAGLRIPYLNGGLFDESRDPQEPIILPDSLFDPMSNEGLLAFFNRYNFTIADDTPLEQDVAVDPEMLGKVFENMLEERDRGQSGSFYTPRSIVSYMCQEALAGYLEEIATVPRATTRAQFDPDSPIPYSNEEAQQVMAALDHLTVLDPAVGSGSFLVGMMTEIIRLRRACYQTLHGVQEVPSATVAEWKEVIIRDTLYGVDIKPEAIEIAQLRLWLALVVDQTLEQAHPLPNLDYKLMAGNSLIETIDGEPVLGQSAAQMLAGQMDDSTSPMIPVQMGLGMFATQQALTAARRSLADLHQEFFNAAPEARTDLRQRILSQERQIVHASLREKMDRLSEQIGNYTKRQAELAAQRATLSKRDENALNAAVQKLGRLQDLLKDLTNPEKALPFFLYKMHFSHVFNGKGGFDIVVANPPYVRMELFKDQKVELEATYPDVYSGRADLYVYFFARGYNLLKPQGQLAYITSNKWLRAKYGEGLRDFLRTKMILKTLIDFGDLPIFDAAAYPCILLGKKEIQANTKVQALSVTDIETLENLPMWVENLAAYLEQTSLSREAWQVLGGEISRVITKLTTNSTKLEKYIAGKFYRGIVTGLNDAFVIDEATREHLINEDPNNEKIIKPFLVGRDIKRWSITNEKHYLIFTYHGIDIAAYPTIKKYLEPYKERLEARATSANHKWYELQQPQMGIYPEFDKPKIIYPDIAVNPHFALDEKNGFYHSNTAYSCSVADYFLLGILNSQCVYFFYSSISSQIRGGYYRFFTQYVEQLPIPNPPADLRQKIATLAQQCLAIAKDHPEKLPALEAKLNTLVYEAYGLDEEDIAVIEGHLAGRDSASSTIPEEVD